MDEILHKLSPDLIEIYKLELTLGNIVIRVDEPAGSLCPYAVVFKLPLHKLQIESSLRLPKTVQFYVENSDPHYPFEALYQSETSRHIVSGPLPEKSLA